MFYIQTCPRQWSKWLDLEEVCYNTSFHSALGRSPFEVMYGFAPHQFRIRAADEQPVIDLPSWLHDRELMTDLIRQHLLRAKQPMKKQDDKHRSKLQFQIGHWVWCTSNCNHMLSPF